LVLQAPIGDCGPSLRSINPYNRRQLPTKSLGANGRRLHHAPPSSKSPRRPLYQRQRSALSPSLLATQRLYGHVIPLPRPRPRLGLRQHPDTRPPAGASAAGPPPAERSLRRPPSARPRASRPRSFASVSNSAAAPSSPSRRDATASSPLASPPCWPATTRPPRSRPSTRTPCSCPRRLFAADTTRRSKNPRNTSRIRYHPSMTTTTRLAMVIRKTTICWQQGLTTVISW
ncbi:hypothetical protein BC826DRAFT_1167900, partial [Russula brevipes]